VISADEKLIHEREALLAALDASIMRGIADSEADRVVDIDDVAARLDAKYGSYKASREKP
jgi:antitoxin ParD1/3/4